MKIKFNKDMTVEFVDHRYKDDSETYGKMFYVNDVVEVERVNESVRGFVDLVLPNGDELVGIPKQGLTIL